MKMTGCQGDPVVRSVMRAGEVGGPEADTPNSDTDLASLTLPGVLPIRLLSEPVRQPPKPGGPPWKWRVPFAWLPLKAWRP
jgi:hypothetical protein